MRRVPIGTGPDMIITVPRKKENATMEIENKNLPALNTQVGTIAALTDYINNADPQQTIGKLLKFSKGEFLLGQDAEVIAEGTTYVVAADMVLTGFIRWDNGKPVEHKLVRISSGEPLFRAKNSDTTIVPRGRRMPKASRGMCGRQRSTFR